MLLHLDASTHARIEGLPMQDLVVCLDDADGRMLYARFVEQEGTASTLEALKYVLERWGRFCEFYTDRESHFCRTTDAKQGPDEEQQGQVSRVLKALGIRHILARTPQARDRSERCFGTLQDGCRRSCVWLASKTTRRPTGIWRSASWRTSMATSPPGFCRPVARNADIPPDGQDQDVQLSAQA
jgi:hypothetical protein